ncbi:hypothetical protein Vretifemale_8345, partial [Volvox reticuliferus]
MAPGGALRPQVRARRSRGGAAATASPQWGGRTGAGAGTDMRACINFQTAGRTIAQGGAKQHGVLRAGAKSQCQLAGGGNDPWVGLTGDWRCHSDGAAGRRRAHVCRKVYDRQGGAFRRLFFVRRSDA